VQHFRYLSDAERDAIFAVPPQWVSASAPLAVQGAALGAMIYSPATRPALDLDSRRLAQIGTTSHVWCLEDAIAHADLPAAERNVSAALRRLARSGVRRAHLPRLFLRVREPGQLRRVIAAAGPGGRLLSGVVLPKFSAASAVQLEELAELSEQLDQQLMALPVLETPAVAWLETRRTELLDLRTLCDTHRQRVPAVRVGGTDLCGLFGLRRDAATAIWDVAVVRDALADIVNIFGRGGDRVVSGPVWEHFSDGARPVAGPWAQQSPDGTRLAAGRGRHTGFSCGRTASTASTAASGRPDPLAREVGLDLANGMTGKTVVHPRHVGIVNALHAVRREEYDDACAVDAAATLGGAFPSGAGNKMNEAGPHAPWARATLRRAAAFGVLATPERLGALLAAGQRAHDAAFSRARPVAGSQRYAT